MVGLRAGCGGRCGGPFHRPLAGPAVARVRACSRSAGICSMVWGVGGRRQGGADGRSRSRAKDVGLTVRGPVVVVPCKMVPGRMCGEVKVRACAPFVIVVDCAPMGIAKRNVVYGLRLEAIF